MGLSSKEVSSDHGHGWNKAMMPKPSSSSSKQPQKQEQSEPLNCPRCDSTNTKFCYYNNYNKSQPRHFCKACKRHWTKGGTLRNVPVGGGRKNKRKASNATSKTTTKTTTMTIQPQQPRLSLPLGTLGGVDEKNLSEAFYQTLGRHPPCSMPESSNGIFLSSTLSLPLPHNDQELNFPYSNLGSFDQSNPCSISSIQSPNLYNSLEETMMNSLNTNLSSSSMSMSDNLHQTQQQQQQQISWSMANNNSSNLMGISSNWGWDDFEKFVSVDEDELTIPWDDADIKP